MPITAGLYYTVFDGNLTPSQPPIVLLHGAGGSHLCWPIELRRLENQRVIAVDLPGHGRSEGMVQQSIAAYADQLRDFLAGMEIHQVMLVGHSMGGAIALSLAQAYPNLVTSLGLIASGAYLGVPEDLLESLSSPVTYPVALRLLQQRAFHPHTPAALVEKAISPLRAVRSSALYADWRACANFDLRPEVAEIKCPTWVAVGVDDRITPLPYAHFLATQLPSARLQVVPNAGHMVIVEQPELLAQGLSEFLRNLSPARYEQVTHPVLLSRAR